ncbi:AMP-binding protein [Ramlibacter albus]|uniref:AMP-binding protein n=1 Tax=Ramlibacter albus TaxID=2079448 RepID=A0A923ME73_9BURK|nr:AMP-binding protein [Ramlibacter albus]MBC5767936.1 AMP-binding protein [Ramlibacter albus]
MYPGAIARQSPDRLAVVMAGTGIGITYAELDARSNQLAHHLRAQGLARGDHFSIFMENCIEFVEGCAAGERSGLYYTCINSYLTAGELAYILNNSMSRVLVTTAAKFEVARAALPECQRITECVVVGGAGEVTQVGECKVRGYEETLRDYPSAPVADESLGGAMLYSSGTTGRPKGVLRPMPDQPPEQAHPLSLFLAKLWRAEDGMRYLSPAPLYHAAPVANVGVAIRAGGTVVVMERFEAEDYLRLVERYRITHTQLVPTMFSRMLKLPLAMRHAYDLSSLKIAVHAAAPCPVPVKEQMIQWWGPIIHEYYGATEGLGFTACDSQEWLAHKGTVGRVLLGDMHILDAAMQPVPKGEPGQIWFKPANVFEYFNDPERTKAAFSPDGVLTTVGDVGYVEDGFLYLTDRASFMIISGGVNIYPQETENLLITHPKVGDAAVFGIPDDDLGEQVKAVVEPLAGVQFGPALERELMDFCHANLARHKCPKSIDFTEQLPRLPTGKLYKTKLREPYWAGRGSRIV